ncbi:MAG: YecA family protein [Thiohalocapsa sp.]|nr:YecA family protein [Thiohalocapsa sp.]
MVQPALDYDTLNQLLGASTLSPSPAEAQGIYCALLAADAPDAESRWLAELLPRDGGDRDDVQSCRRALADVAAETRKIFQGEAGGLDPLLPAESASLEARAVAVHEWVRGFMFGLALARIETKALSAPTQEAIDDFMQLMRMDLDDLQDDEANEAALAEIIEFVRVAAMLVREDMVAKEKD